MRTGVTVILPHGDNLFRQKVPGAVYTINGFGKVCGFEEVRELGVIEAPIALTNTENVGLVADALVQHAIRQSPEIGIQTSNVNVIVGECSDAYLNDIQGRHVHAAPWAGLFPAVVECVEEAIVNLMFRAETMVGRDGNTRTALPVDDVAALVRRFRPEAAP